MQQPPGFVDPSKPTYLCRFHKAIVGLRQAQLAWFQRFSTYLLQSGFRQSVADTSIFLHHSSTGCIVLLFYVDEIILTGDNGSLLTQFIHRLNKDFAMKDLGDLTDFLGIEAQRDSSGLLPVTNQICFRLTPPDQHAWLQTLCHTNCFDCETFCFGWYTSL